MKETLTCATSWMYIEDLMLSEISQSQKDKYCMISHMRYLQLTEAVETQNRIAFARNWVMLFNG